MTIDFNTFYKLSFNRNILIFKAKKYVFKMYRLLICTGQLKPE